ncbi:hypothetical protein BGX31_001930 [Mortierella sp. GBA43]|nr:hypothetical protein BGX31_001930 [Mortierella sp. GBA43]
MSYIQLLPQYTSELTAGPIAPAPIQPGNPGLTSSGQLGPQSMSAPSPMARLPILSGQSQTVGSTASCRSKALSRLQPKAAKQSGRASLKTKLQHLQECLKYEQEYRELTGNEPEKRSYEKKRGLPEKYIPRLLAARDKLERMPAQTLSKRFNVRTRPFYPVEILLVKMISDIRDKHIPIDQRFLQLMAHEIYTLLLSQVGTLLFARPSFSVGWVYNFRRYWKIDYQQLKGKAGSVDMERIAGRIDEIKAIISD